MVGVLVSSVNHDLAEQSDHMAYLLHMATRRLRAEAEAGPPEAVAPLRAAQARLLDLIPPPGGRVTDLARQMHISKQGLGQLTSQLANLGLVEVTNDPADKRAKLVRRTPTGNRTQRAMRRTIAAVEDRWADQIGHDRYATFRSALQQLVADPWQTDPSASPEPGEGPPPSDQLDGRGGVADSPGEP